MWASITEANGYLAETVGGEAWSSLSADSKTAYLTTAFRRLSRDPGYSFPDEVSENMRDANIEYAFWLLNNGNQATPSEMSAQGVAGFTIGTFSMQFRNSSEMGAIPAHYPQVVLDLLDEYQNVGRAVQEVSARELS